MTKILKMIAIVSAAVFLIFGASVIVDRHQLNIGIIRLHVVAQSDSHEDQTVKFRVRDAIIHDLQSNMGKLKNQAEAQQYLKCNLQRLENVANATLFACNVNYKAKIKFGKEAFDTRHYDTFSLPSGVYESLRIELGDAQGENWWCVVFPSLCMQASADTEDVSVFSDRLNDTIQGKEQYELRFFLLDWLGSLEKFFFQGE